MAEWFEKRTLGNLLDLAVTLFGSKEALSFEGQRWYTLKRMGVLYNQIILYAGDDGYKDEARENMQRASGMFQMLYPERFLIDGLFFSTSGGTPLFKIRFLNLALLPSSLVKRLMLES